MIGSLYDLTRLPGMPSAARVRRMISDNPDFPVIQLGGKGREYRFDLDKAAAFIRELQARKDREAVRAADATIGTLDELSCRPGMPSLPTLHTMIRNHPDFPIIERGRKGRPYRIDFKAAAAFIVSLNERPPMDAETRRRAIRELGLETLARHDRAAASGEHEP